MSDGLHDEPEFETFTKRAKRILGEPAMTIQKGGGLSFNRAAFDALGAPKAVELLYDQKRQIIGVRPVDPGVSHSYNVQGNRGGSTSDKGFIISGKAFTAYYDIPANSPRRWKAYMLNGVLCVDLSGPFIEVSSRGRKAAPAS